MNDVAPGPGTGRIDQIGSVRDPPGKSDPGVVSDLSDDPRVARRKTNAPPAAVEKPPPSHPPKNLIRKIKKTVIKTILEFKFFANIRKN